MVRAFLEEKEYLSVSEEDELDIDDLAETERGPNGYDCGECENWDPVNGCWANHLDIFDCPVFLTMLRDEEPI